MSEPDGRPVLEELWIADAPATWSRLGFAVTDDAIALGGVTLRLQGPRAGEGIVGWRVHGLGSANLDGLPQATASAAQPGRATDVAHPNGAVALDHVVALTDDVDRATATLVAAGLDLRGVREVPGDGDRSQAFFSLGPALLELAGPAGDDGCTAFWGLTISVSDLDALARRLGDRLGEVRPAVQPGRRIATLRGPSGSSVAMAFMTPRLKPVSAPADG